MSGPATPLQRVVLTLGKTSFLTGMHHVVFTSMIGARVMVRKSAMNIGL